MEAASGRRAFSLLVTDWEMPRLDGCGLTQKIRADGRLKDLPVILITSLDSPDNKERGIRAGADAYVVKNAFDQEKLLKVVRRRRDSVSFAPVTTARDGRRRAPRTAVVIGSSTGGPAVLYTLLKALPMEFQLPIVVVQHMTSGFTQSLVDWLQLASARPLQVARHQQRLVPGVVYFAPEEHHLEILRRGVLGLTRADPVSYVRPSATVLLQSAANQYGSEVVGVLLTGMGDDGALGLKAIHDRGGATLVQGEASCVVFGMPKKAIELGAADFIVAPELLASTLMEIASP